MYASLRDMSFPQEKLDADVRPSGPLRLATVLHASCGSQ
jgi:hypothetical protein